MLYWYFNWSDELRSLASIWEIRISCTPQYMHLIVYFILPRCAAFSYDVSIWSIGQSTYIVGSNRSSNRDNFLSWLKKESSSSLYPIVTEHILIRFVVNVYERIIITYTSVLNLGLVLLYWNQIEIQLCKSGLYDGWRGGCSKNSKYQSFNLLIADFICKLLS